MTRFPVLGGVGDCVLAGKYGRSFLSPAGATAVAMSWIAPGRGVGRCAGTGRMLHYACL
jgi:hypothetical protein